MPTGLLGPSCGAAGSPQVRPLPLLEGKKRSEAQRKEEGSVCEELIPAAEQHGEMGLRRISREGARREIPSMWSARGSKSQAINNQLKGNNRIQWRTINKIPLV